MFNLIVPVYKNQDSIPSLIKALDLMSEELDGKLRVVFVVDGSPDLSFSRLRDGLESARFPSQLITLSKNFGSLVAIKVGLENAHSGHSAVMAADLQEPPELIVRIFRALESGRAEVVVGTREFRADPFFTRVSASLFWALYRKFVQPEMPPGGVDVFGCTESVREQLVRLNEANSSLIGLIFWVGFRREFISYSRVEREHGKSAWTLAKKIKYLLDSVFSFSDLPIRALIGVGTAGITLSILLAAFIVMGKIFGRIPVPGYTTTLTVICFFAGLNSFGLGIIGNYVWRAFENTKGRPIGIVMGKTEFSRSSTG